MAMIWLWVSADFYAAMHDDHEAAVASAHVLQGLDAFSGMEMSRSRETTAVTAKKTRTRSAFKRVSGYYLGEI